MSNEWLNNACYNELHNEWMNNELYNECHNKCHKMIALQMNRAHWGDVELDAAADEWLTMMNTSCVYDVRGQWIYGN